jgi:ABC-type glucose/galactose transport system permease subunit
LCSASFKPKGFKISNLILLGAKKALFITSNIAFLQSMWSIFWKNSTHYFSTLNQDPTIQFQNIKNQKIYKEIQFMQFGLEVPILECFFLKHNQGTLGINIYDYWGNKEGSKILFYL